MNVSNHRRPDSQRLALLRIQHATYLSETRPRSARSSTVIPGFFPAPSTGSTGRRMTSASPMSSIAKNPGSPAVSTIPNRKSAFEFSRGRKRSHRWRFLRAPNRPSPRASGNGISASTNAYRVVNGEGDFLPGLIVDRYADFFVCQFFTAGMALFKARHRRSSVAARTQRRRSLRRAKDGSATKKVSSPSMGALRGEAPPDLIVRSRKTAISSWSMSGAGKKPAFF